MKPKISKRSVIFITQPNFAVNHPQNNFKLYRRNRNGKVKIFQCRDKEHYRSELQKYVCGYFGYSRDSTKAHYSMLDYFMGSMKDEDVMSINKMKREEMVVGKDGSYLTDESAIKLQNKWLNYIEDSNSHIAVLSFVNEFIDENINIKDLQKIIATSVMPKFLKFCGYEKPKDNLDWAIALHTDQDNYHFHLCWLEKNKCYKTEKKGLQHRFRLTLTAKEIAMLKRQIIQEIERKKYMEPLLERINKELQIFESYFNSNDHNYTLNKINDLSLEDKILRLGFLLKEVRDTNRKYIKYNSLPKNEIGNEIRKLTKDIKKSILSDSKYKVLKENIDTSINDLNTYYETIDRDNNISDGFSFSEDNTMIEGKLKRTDDFILNAIVNHAIYNMGNVKGTDSKTEKITVNDVINEIVLENYYNEGQPKLDDFKVVKRYKIEILKYHFLKKEYKYKSRVNKAFDRLLYSGDEVASKFYEMFKEDGKGKNL